MSLSLSLRRAAAVVAVVDAAVVAVVCFAVPPQSMRASAAAVDQRDRKSPEAWPTVHPQPHTLPPPLEPPKQSAPTTAPASTASISQNPPYLSCCYSVGRTRRAGDSQPRPLPLPWSPHIACRILTGECARCGSARSLRSSDQPCRATRRIFASTRLFGRPMRLERSPDGGWVAVGWLNVWVCGCVG